VYLDIIIIIPLLYGLIKGVSNGLVKEITGVLSLIIGIYVAVNFSEFLGDQFLGDLENYEKIKPILSFAVLFIVSVLIIKLIGGLVNKIAKYLGFGIISRIFGGIFGILKVTLIVGFLLNVESKFNIIPEEERQSSLLYNYTLNILDIAALKFEDYK